MARNGLITLREKCLNTEFFLVRKSPFSVRIQENTDQKKLRIWTLFTQCNLLATMGQLPVNAAVNL